MNNISNQFVVYIEQDEDGVFIGSIPSVQSCYAQGDTQEEMMNNLHEVLILCLRNKESQEVTTQFIGIQTFSLSHAKAHTNQSQKIHQVA